MRRRSPATRLFVNAGKQYSEKDLALLAKKEMIPEHVSREQILNLLDKLQRYEQNLKAELQIRRETGRSETDFQAQHARVSGYIDYLKNHLAVLSRKPK